MADPHVVTGLIAKRAEVAGKIEHRQDELRQLVIDLDHIDAAIHLFAPDVILEAIKSKPLPPRHAAFRGEVSRIVLSTLRNAKRPLTSAEIAQRVMAERGLDTQNERLLKLMVKRIGACLRMWEQRGVASKEPGPDSFKLWMIRSTPQ